MGTMHLGFATTYFYTAATAANGSQHEYVTRRGKHCLCGSAGYGLVLTTKSLNLLRTEAPLLLYLGSVIRLVTVYVT